MLDIYGMVVLVLMWEEGVDNNLKKKKIPPTIYKMKN